MASTRRQARRGCVDFRSGLLLIVAFLSCLAASEDAMDSGDVGHPVQYYESSDQALSIKSGNEMRGGGGPKNVQVGPAWGGPGWGGGKITGPVHHSKNMPPLAISSPPPLDNLPPPPPPPPAPDSPPPPPHPDVNSGPSMPWCSNLGPGSIQGPNGSPCPPAPLPNQKYCTENVTVVLKPANVTIPGDWVCPKSWYANNDGCDCDCGAYDPDCGIQGVRDGLGFFFIYKILVPFFPFFFKESGGVRKGYT